MKVLVTGDAGLVGRHMTKYLVEVFDAEVYGYDIRDGDDAVDYFRSANGDEYFDLVVHCAYVVGGRETIDGNNLALAKNVQLDGALFDWALRTHQGAVIYYSSSAAYPAEYQTEDFAPRTLKEDDIYLPDPGTPDANYGWAKLTGERIAAQFASLGGRVHILRPFSGFATDQDLTYPFPAIVNRVLRGDFSCWGPRGQTRDWIHIDDVVAASLEIYFQDVREPINLCTGIGTEFGDLVRMIHYYNTGEEGIEVTYDPDKPTGVFYRVGDPYNMFRYYEPQITLEEAICNAIGNYHYL